MAKKNDFESFVKNALGNLSDRSRDIFQGQLAQEKRLDDIEQVLRGISRAVDKDAVKVIDHERRITRLEIRSK
jgi:hypothetical protein